MNPGIKDYIEKAKKAGYSDIQVKENLQKAGWQESDINDALGISKSDDPPITKSSPDSKKQKTSVLAILSLIFSFILPPLGFILSIISIIVISKKKQKGLVLSIIALVLSVIMTFVFIIGIGALTMLLIANSVEDSINNLNTTISADLIKCGSDVSVEVLPIGDKYRICITEPTSEANGKMGMFLQNNGVRDITSLKVRISWDKGIYEKEMNVSLIEGSINSYKVEIDKTVGEGISIIQILPAISTASSSKIYCNEPNLDWDEEELAYFEDCNNTTWYSNIK